MTQEQKDTIINTVKDIGIRDTLKLIGGDKDIIRQVYIDNPESYLDNLKYKPYVYEAGDRTLFKVTGDRNYSFAWFDLGNSIITINNTTIDFKFYESIMELSKNQTCGLFKDWLDKHYDGFVEIKRLRPILYSI